VNPFAALTAESILPRCVAHVLAQPQSASVAVLTSRIAAGDEAAFREFHASYRARLLRYALVLFHGNEDRAGEAVQHLFVRVARKARRFDEEDAFWSWLCVVLRNCAIDLIRHQKRYDAALNRYSHEQAFPEAEQADALLERALNLALAQLDEDDRMLLEAKYREDLSVIEIAAQHAATAKAVEGRLARARARLRAHILQLLRHDLSD
jgi:RNA polymerase sigma factor (sigma-70 family)